MISPRMRLMPPFEVDAPNGKSWIRQCIGSILETTPHLTVATLNNQKHSPIAIHHGGNKQPPTYTLPPVTIPTPHHGSGGSRISCGGIALTGGGRGLPRWLHFENFVCQNERIWTSRGRCWARPLDPPMHGKTEMVGLSFKRPYLDDGASRV